VKFAFTFIKKICNPIKFEKKRERKVKNEEKVKNK